MYVCMYVCMYMYMYIYTHTHVGGCVCVCMCVYTGPQLLELAGQLAHHHRLISLDGYSYEYCVFYARRMGQRATNYTARSNIDTAQIFLHANGQRPKRAPIRQRSQRRQRRGEPHTEHGLGVLLAQHSLNTFHTHTAASMKRDRRKSLHTGENRTLPRRAPAL